MKFCAVLSLQPNSASQPRPEVTVRHGLLDGDEFVADLDDVLDGLLHPLPDAVGA